MSTKCVSGDIQPNSNDLHPTSHGPQPKSIGLQSTSDGLQPDSNGLQPHGNALQIVMAFNLMAMASNKIVRAFTCPINFPLKSDTFSINPPFKLFTHPIKFLSPSPLSKFYLTYGKNSYSISAMPRGAKNQFRETLWLYILSAGHLL